MKPVAELVDAIRSKGGRITPQRIAVIDAINESCNHPTIDEIFDEVVKTQKSLSRKTVYQIVNDLASIGAVTLVDVGTGQTRVDPTTEKIHDHFVCINCSRVEDVHRKSKVAIKKDVLEYGEVQSVDIVYRGVCKDCTSQN